MKKTWIICMAAIAFAWVSCEKASNSEVEVVDGMVKVRIGANSGSATKTSVTAGGVTNWMVNDEVHLVPMDLDTRQAKSFPFSVLSVQAANPGPTADLEGFLPAQGGLSKYGAFYMPYSNDPNEPCNHGISSAAQLLNGTKLTIHYHHTHVTMNSSTSDAFSTFGKYCPMVAKPLDFDPLVPSTMSGKSYRFFHATHLFRFMVYPTTRRGEQRSYGNIEFDNAVCRIETEQPYFNDEIVVDLGTVENHDFNWELGDQNAKSTIGEVDVKYQNGAKQYVSINSRLHNTQSYDIPMFLIPTREEMPKATYTVSMYKDGVKVMEFRRVHSFIDPTPLYTAGISVIAFYEEDMVNLN